MRAFTFFAKRDILRAAVFLWMTFFDEAFWIIGMALAKAFCASPRFFPSTAFSTFLEKVLRTDLTAVLRSWRFLLCRALFRAETWVAKKPPQIKNAKRQEHSASLFLLNNRMS